LKTRKEEKKKPLCLPASWGGEGDHLGKKKGETVFQVGNKKEIWRKRERPEESYAPIFGKEGKKKDQVTVHLSKGIVFHHVEKGKGRFFPNCQKK